MGYPKLGSGVDRFCMSVTKLKPMTVCKQQGKAVRVLISELNPPICKLIKELAEGGPKGSVPIKFASRQTIARLCPPPTCDCSPCKKSKKEERNKVLTALKIAFLAGTILAFWYIGGLGPTWDTWNLKECIKNMYYSCKNIQFVYKDKCCKPIESNEEKDPNCIPPMSKWNEKVLICISACVNFYYKVKEWFYEELNRGSEECHKEVVKQEKKEKEGGKEKSKDAKEEDKPVDDCKKKKDCADRMFNDLDPINIKCKQTPDYWCMLYKMKHDDPCVTADKPAATVGS